MRIKVVLIVSPNPVFFLHCISYVRLPPVQGEPFAGVDDPLDAPLAGFNGMDAALEAGLDGGLTAFSLKICGRSVEVARGRNKILTSYC